MPKTTTVNVGSVGALPPPPPPGVMKGWELTPTNVGLTPHGIVGADLPEYVGPNFIPAGTHIVGRKFTGTQTIFVDAGDITFEKCYFAQSAIGLEGHMVIGWYPKGDITFKDCEFDGSNLPPNVREAACAFAGGGNMYRNYIHDVGSGIAQMSSTNTRNFGDIPNTITIENNYVHKLFHYSGAHHEAATVRDFVSGTVPRQMTWRGNYFLIDTLFVSASLFIQATWEDIHNVTVVDNLIGGDGWNIDLMDSPGTTTYSGMKAHNNRFVAGTRDYYGPANIQTGVGWQEWTENYMYDAAAPEGRGAIVNQPLPPS